MDSTHDKVRRTDRQETDDSFLHELLENSISCSIAVETDDFPLIHVAFFVYDKEQNDIVFHFSKYGFGGEQLTDGKKVSVSIYKYGKLYTADKAVDFGCEYQSIIIYSKLRIVSEESERIEAMQLFFNKFFKHIPKTDFKDFTTIEANPIYVARINVDKWFGKQHLLPLQKAKTSFYSEIGPVI